MKKISSPSEEYDNRKANFLTKFWDVSAWGNWVSRQRLVALDEFVEYLEQTVDLVDLDEDLKDQIYNNHVDILLGRITAMPEVLAT